MANLTIRNIPDDVYERLKRRAAVNRRSLNKEVLNLLERVVGSPEPGETEAILHKMKTIRQSIPPFDMTDEEITQAKRKGRW